MAHPPYQPARIFTVDQANACLPLVRSIVADMVQLDQLTQGRKSPKGSVYSEELDQMEEELEKDLERLNGYAGELLELGVEPKGAAEGLVDFPCLIEGRLSYLCWQSHAPEILFWHDLESGFAGRQPLHANVSSDGELGGSDAQLGD
jgi:hypothetical protein